MGARGKVKRKDGPHKEIVAALEAFGACVLDLSGVGGGCPDILVSYKRKMFLMEIKTKGQDLNEKQQKWADNWCGTVHLVWTAHEALDVIRKNPKWV